MDRLEAHTAQYVSLLMLSFMTTHTSARSTTSRKQVCLLTWRILVDWLLQVLSISLWIYRCCDKHYTQVTSWSMTPCGAMIFFVKGVKEVNKQGKEVLNASGKPAKNSKRIGAEVSGVQTC